MHIAKKIVSKFTYSIIYYRIIGFLFKLDKWHSTATPHARKYREEISEIINGIHPKTIIEVGCGLGLILKNCNADTIVGYDNNLNVIRAAKFITNKKIIFKHGSIEDITEENIDVLILVNWIHAYSPQDIKIMIQSILPKIKYLVVDRISYSLPIGRYQHDFEFIKYPKIYQKIIDDGMRELIVFKIYGAEK